MNTELKLVIINNEIPKRTIYVVQMGAAYRSFDTRDEAELHAQILQKLGHHEAIIREIYC